MANGVVAMADSGNGRVYAYDATTGVPMWTSVQGSDQLAIDQLKDFTIASGTAFVLTTHYLAAYNAGNGKLKWLAPIIDPDAFNGAQQFGGIVYDQIIIAGYSWIDAISIHSGRELWRELWRESLPDSGPKWPLVSNQVVIANVCLNVSCESAEVIGIDPVNGNQLWSQPTFDSWSDYQAPSESLGSGMLLLWGQSGLSDTTVAAIQPRTGKRSKPGT